MLAHISLGILPNGWIMLPHQLSLLYLEVESPNFPKAFLLKIYEKRQICLTIWGMVGWEESQGSLHSLSDVQNRPRKA